MDKKWLVYGAFVLLGVIIAPKVGPAIRRVPVVGAILPA
jgi:hypothetical protein